MSQYSKLILSLLFFLFLGGIKVDAAPRIIRSNATGNTALWLTLKKETKGQYLLLISHEGQKEAEKFKLSADSTGANSGILKFTPGEEARATTALKGYEDVIAHTPANDAEATGDAAGDVNSFINGVVRKDGADGVLILPATAPLTDEPKTTGVPTWLIVLGSLIAGVGGGYLVSRSLKPNAHESVAVAADEELAPTTGNTDLNTAEQTAQKLKKAQKDLKEAKASLDQLTKKAETEAGKNAALEGDYQALEARLKIANGTIAAVQEQARGIQTQLQQLQENGAKQEAYFKAAANQIVRPFTDFVSSSKINPIDKGSQAIVEEQMVIMAFHYFSLVRYGAGIWDEHDIYNIQRNGPLGAEHKAANPQGVSVDVKSGYPNLVLTVAELLRQAGANGAAMDISLRGYRFEQRTV